MQRRFPLLLLLLACSACLAQEPRISIFVSEFGAPRSQKKFEISTTTGLRIFLDTNQIGGFKRLRIMRGGIMMGLSSSQVAGPHGDILLLDGDKIILERNGLGGSGNK